MRKGKRIAKEGDIVLLEATGEGFFSFGYGAGARKGEVTIAILNKVFDSGNRLYLVSETLAQSSDYGRLIKEICVLGRV